MKLFLLAFLGLLLITSNVSAFQPTFEMIEKNLSQGANNLAGDGTSTSGTINACNSEFFQGANCGFTIYGVVTLLLLNLLIVRLGLPGTMALLSNYVWLFILDHYQLMPRGVLVAAGLIGGLILAWALVKMSQAR